MLSDFRLLNIKKEILKKVGYQTVDGTMEVCHLFDYQLQQKKETHTDLVNYPFNIVLLT